MSELSGEDKFEYWLMDMDDAIEGFIQYLPNHIANKLDYSIESLSTLETWLLDKYDSIEKIKPQSESTIVDGAARYIGETYRRALGGKWNIDFSDDKNAFHIEIKNPNGCTGRPCCFLVIL